MSRFGELVRNKRDHNWPAIVLDPRDFYSEAAYRLVIAKPANDLVLFLGEDAKQMFGSLREPPPYDPNADMTGVTRRGITLAAHLSTIPDLKKRLQEALDLTGFQLKEKFGDDNKENQQQRKTTTAKKKLATATKKQPAPKKTPATKEKPKKKVIAVKKFNNGAAPKKNDSSDSDSSDSEASAKKKQRVINEVPDDDVNSNVSDLEDDDASVGF